MNGISEYTNMEVLIGRNIITLFETGETCTGELPFKRLLLRVQ